MAKILIIDDEVDMCWVLSNVLEAEGYNAVSAHDGPSGLELLERERPDLVLLDLRLPGMDGIEILRRIKQKYGHLPVVIITGYGSLDSAVEVMKMGAFDYISKPFENEKVIATVGRALGIDTISGGKDYYGPSGKRAGNPVGSGGRTAAKSNKKQYARGVITVSLLLFMMAACEYLIYGKFFKKTLSYPIPYTHASAMAYDGRYIWTADWFSQNIYRHEIDSRVLNINGHYLVGIHPTGLAWDGEYFWTTDSWTKKIYRHNPRQNFAVVKSYRSPSTSPGAIMWDGKNLWTADSDTDRIYKHNMDDSLSVNAVYNSPSTNPSGLVWDGKNIFSSDADTNKIYKHNMDINLSVAKEYVLKEYSGNMSVLSGFCWDGKTFWSCSEGANELHKHNLNRIRFGMDRRR